VAARSSRNLSITDRENRSIRYRDRAQHLQQFRGILQADAYAGFNGLYDREDEPLIEAACWARVRRKFFDIHATTASPIALEALTRVGALYAIETETRGHLPDQRKAARQAHAAPLLKDLYDWWLSGSRRCAPQPQTSASSGDRRST